ncbi:MAG: HPr kinase/phosphorylase [Clostridia bacterium]|nr:HPr kinase/phosphorylase [Clostridia bacterium]MBO4885165.1 HPr kinase/phosphorylase [Clostridia bacterium]MBR4442945.1 HPr kinase/phosphorylase [Clostridia bacterium]
MVDAAMMVKALKLTELVPSETGVLPIETSDINRPGLPFAGYWEHFAHERPQVLGLVETSYLHSLDPETRRMRLKQFVSYDLPCIIICRRLEGMDDMIELAAERRIPVYRSDVDTTKLIVDLIYFLNNHLAPRMTMHGVLVEIYGVGVLLTGESGVGKSEAALELVKRGHRLVADDVVDVRRVSENRLTGEAPEMVRNLMEIRGIGIIDVATMFGIGSVMRSKSIDMIVHLEHWVKGKEYDRVGLDDKTHEILGVQVPWLLLPIRPGRNVAVVLEVASRNLTLKQQGYSAARELEKRMIARMEKTTARAEQVVDAEQP